MHQNQPQMHVRANTTQLLEEKRPPSRWTQISEPGQRPTHHNGRNSCVLDYMAMHMFDKESWLAYIRNLPTQKKQNNAIKKWAKDLDTSQRKMLKWPINM